MEGRKLTVLSIGHETAKKKGTCFERKRTWEKRKGRWTQKRVEKSQRKTTPK